MRNWIFVLALLCSFCAHADPLRIAIVDTGLDISDWRFQGTLCSAGHRDFTGTGLEDTLGHGTHIAGLVADFAGPGDFCLIILKYYIPGDALGNLARSTAALEYAAFLGVSFVNYSTEGPTPDERERAVLKNNPRVTFVVAAGNSGRKFSSTFCAYPACYSLKNVVPVGALNEQGQHSDRSNYGARVKIWEPGTNISSTLPLSFCGFGSLANILKQSCDGIFSGTSQATAIHTGKLIKEKLSHEAYFAQHRKNTGPACTDRCPVRRRVSRNSAF